MVGRYGIPGQWIFRRSFRTKVKKNPGLASYSQLKKLNPKDTKQFWKAMKFLNRRVKSVPTLSDGPNVACSAYEKANSYAQ